MSAVARRRIEFFSHPLCSGCSDVLNMLITLERELSDVIEVQRWTLALPAGRLRALELGVTEVPTVVVDGGETIVGVPGDVDDLRHRILGSPGA